MRLPRVPARRAAQWAVLAAAGLACGCDPQMDASYLGEPLVTLRGHVTGASPVPLEAAMLWQRGAPPSYDDVDLATRAPLEAGFPASFTLRLYQPPPAAARRSLATGEVAFARANAAAIPYGIATGAVPALPPPPGLPSATGSFAEDTAHWVLWLAAPVPKGSLTEWWVGGALPGGYALLRVKDGCPTPEELAACIDDLVRRGVPEDGSGAPGTAGGYCRAPYRLSPASAGDEIELVLPPPTAAPATCP
ncbi:MAG TPA: hypothetical protein VFK90_09135 [Anaeromyxobacter sp.]|nr:hypothetical protein [Anaeromyxobacter sp.]